MEPNTTIENIMILFVYTLMFMGGLMIADWVRRFLPIPVDWKRFFAQEWREVEVERREPSTPEALAETVLYRLVHFVAPGEQELVPLSDLIKGEEWRVLHPWDAEQRCINEMFRVARVRGLVIVITGPLRPRSRISVRPNPSKIAP